MRAKLNRGDYLAISARNLGLAATLLEELIDDVRRGQLSERYCMQIKGGTGLWPAQRWREACKRPAPYASALGTGWLYPICSECRDRVAKANRKPKSLFPRRDSLTEGLPASASTMEVELFLIAEKESDSRLIGHRHLHEKTHPLGDCRYVVWVKE